MVLNPIELDIILDASIAFSMLVLPEDCMQNDPVDLNESNRVKAFSGQKQVESIPPFDTKTSLFDLTEFH